MVEYEYRDLFYQHDNVTFIIVQHGATVTPVTNDAPTVEDSEWIIVSDTDMTMESFELIESLNSSQNLVFGSVESAYCKFTIFDREDLPNLEDEYLDIYLYFNDNSDTLFQVGSYLVNSDKRSADRITRDIVAYDLLHELSDFDISEWYYGSDEVTGFFPSSSTTHTIVECINSLMQYLKTEGDFPIDLVPDQTLINGTYPIGRTIESDEITFSFFMQRLLEINGVFGHINRQGKFVFTKMEWYDHDPVRVLTANDRIPPTQYNDVATWGIGQIKVYDRNNTRIFKQRNTAKKYPSTYSIVDSFVFADKTKGDAVTKEALRKMQEEGIWHLNYRPCDVPCTGDLCVEVGDRIDVQYKYDESDEPIRFRSYALERRFKGIQGFTDRYTAKGDKKQPKYKITNDNWHNGDSDEGLGKEGISSVFDDFDTHYIEKMRNVGQRVLDEPSDVDAQLDIEGLTVKLKWTDPVDLTDEKPKQCEWAGTYVVRSENNAPMNIYQGDIIKDSTTRDEYSEDWFTDDTIQEGKNYYYGIFPYDTDGNVRWTKVISINTNVYIEAPVIESIEAGSRTSWNGSEVEILSSGEYNTLTVQIDDGHYVFKLYSGSTEIYSFQSPVGSTPTDAKKIHVAFLQDEENEVAKPSFVYHTGSGTYSYNQENPSASEMEAIYKWLHPASYPPEYETYIDTINGTGFFWKDYSDISDLGSGYTQSAITYPFKDYSYFPVGNTSDYSYLQYPIIVDGGDALVGVCDKLTINITSEGDVYSFSNTWNIIDPAGKNDWNSYPWQGFYFNKTPSGRDWDARGFTKYDSYTMSYSGTLAQCLSAIAFVFRNVHIFVDGVKWA